MCSAPRIEGIISFPAPAHNIAAADLGFTEDRFVLAIGKYGKAAAFRGMNGEKVWLEDKAKNRIQRVGMQVDALIEIPLSNDSVVMAEQIIQYCKDFGVRPEWFAMDSTSYGKGVYDILRHKFGDVLGINWQEGATEYKIMAEDEDPPSKVYANIGTEMWYASRVWLEHEIIKFSNGLNTEELFPELTGRRFKPAGKRARQIIESKREYKQRTPGGKSPDSGDSFHMLNMLCRMRGDWLPSLTGNDEDLGGHDEWGDLPPSVEEVDCLVMDQYSTGDPSSSQLRDRWPDAGESW
jgi:hypothetical protein